MEIGVIVCNVDQEVGRATRRYVITSEGRVAEVDLCAEHGAPLEELLGTETPRKAAAPARKTTTARKRTTKRKSTKVVSLDEIERLKKA